MATDDDRVLKALKKAGKPLRPGDISDMTGIDKKAVSASLKNLKNQDVICSPKRCFYEPK